MSSGQIIKPVPIDVEFPSTGFTRSLFFNRFKIERLGNDSLSHFGLVSEAGVLLDAYVCFISKLALEKNKVSMLRYLENIGRAEVTQPIVWAGVTTLAHRIDVVDLMNASSGEHAELSFANLAIGPNLRKGTETKTRVVAQPLIILRSDVETHKQWIDLLYRNVT